METRFQRRKYWQYCRIIGKVNHDFELQNVANFLGIFESNLQIHKQAKLIFSLRKYSIFLLHETLYREYAVPAATCRLTPSVKKLQLWLNIQIRKNAKLFGWKYRSYL
jgi:hypothetical protein